MSVGKNLSQKILSKLREIKLPAHVKNFKIVYCYLKRLLIGWLGEDSRHVFNTSKWTMNKSESMNSNIFKTGKHIARNIIYQHYKQKTYDSKIY